MLVNGNVSAQNAEKQITGFTLCHADFYAGFQPVIHPKYTA